MKPVFSDLDQIDAALRLIDREVWVITATDGNRRGGLLATWVSAASIDRERPVLLTGIGPNHFTAELVQSSRAFAAHLLRSDQIDLAWNFARDSGRGRDKLEGLAVETRETGSPILAECRAWFDCRVFARYEAGDRVFFWGDVVAGADCSPHAPREDRISRSEMPTIALRQNQFLGGLTHEQRQHLSADRQSDASGCRPLQERWRNDNAW
jgi:flavin reductase (DIM6/NTAB) family NADH-FMN oxidoreductase RutF